MTDPKVLFRLRLAGFEARDEAHGRGTVRHALGDTEPTDRSKAALDTILITLEAVREKSAHLGAGGRLH